MNRPTRDFLVAIRHDSGIEGKIMEFISDGNDLYPEWTKVKRYAKGRAIEFFEDTLYVQIRSPNDYHYRNKFGKMIVTNMLQQFLSEIDFGAIIERYKDFYERISGEQEPWPTLDLED